MRLPDQIKEKNGTMSNHLSTAIGLLINNMLYVTFAYTVLNKLQLC